VKSGARLIRRRPPWLIALGAALGAPLIAAPPVLGHALEGRSYNSPLPLAVYLLGAAIAVGLSFAFVLLRDIRAERPAASEGGSLPPAWLRTLLRVLGLVAWIWMAAQGAIGGGFGDGDVVALFLWVYGWVGLAILSAFVGPVWHWLDPFATLHDIGAWLIRTLGIGGWDRAPYPARLGRWPAVAGLAFFVWLELAAGQGIGRPLFIVLVGYTALTLAMMAQFGRDEWRANGETFSVWFGLLNRLAPLTLVDPDGRVRRRRFASGLLERGWSVEDLVLVALGAGSILFDGLSQTEIWFNAFGAPGVERLTLQLAVFMLVVVGAVLLVGRYVGIAATAAGVLPIAVGYLVGHYLTFLLIEGQWIIVAVSDPLRTGQDLFGTARFEPTGDFLPPVLVWAAQLIAVAGGHMLGAWAGHVVTRLEDRAAGGTGESRELRLRQVPLAVIMVALTTVTLWSLGQELVRDPGTEDAAARVAPPAAALEIVAR